ncbi:MAG TPA: GNAT family N-acetyltransferase [Ktedonobacteraceae bacterium]|jgi:ribosomal protein S18 acetylase RimI-like enzyme|nr:GNAT family N-acetyltransferase [Ktedonobacteraceae bacterium]
MACLVKMTEDTFQQWLAPFILAYAQDHVENGRWSAQDAEKLSAEEIKRVVPDGLSTKDQYFYTIVAEEMDQSVGMLWFGMRQRRDSEQTAYVYYIEIDEPFRRSGYAMQAFREMEQIVRALGVHEIGLHTFGSKHGARAMYEKLGYEITNIQMVKKL